MEANTETNIDETLRIPPFEGRPPHYKKRPKPATIQKSPKLEEKPEYRLFKDPMISDYQIREVKPYLHTFETFAKGRWLGRKLLDIVAVEYGGFPIDYWKNAIQSGFIKVNGKSVSDGYLVKNSDLIYHKAHRHEPLVYGEIQLVGETENLLAVNKPASIPMHPCGSYRFNSLEMILKHEPIVKGQSDLFLVHRLDRLTSGLIVMAKDKATAARVSKEIREKSTEKIYLARVKGRFPSRIHQLNEWQSIDYSLYQEESEEQEGTKTSRTKKRKFEEGSNVSSSDGKGDNTKKTADDLQPGILRQVESFEEIIQCSSTGYRKAAVDSSLPFNQHLQQIFPRASPDEYYLSCPLDVISYREGIHACCSDGKPSLSRFRCLGYDPVTDTSLLECKPYTGRTHQLRLHLWLSGNPIANDPCYGGELFYGNQTRRQLALDAMKEMERNLHHRPLSKMPHIQQITSKDDEILLALQRNEKQRLEMERHRFETQKQENVTKEEKQKEEATVGEEMGDDRQNYLLQPYPHETEDEFIIRTCKNCRENQELVRLEHVVHCDAIWLHALRYAGKGWSFETSLPDWTESFKSIGE